MDSDSKRDFKRNLTPRDLRMKIDSTVERIISSHIDEHDIYI